MMVSDANRTEDQTLPTEKLGKMKPARTGLDAVGCGITTTAKFAAGRRQTSTTTNAKAFPTTRGARIRTNVQEQGGASQIIANNDSSCTIKEQTAYTATLLCPAFAD